MKMIGKSYVLFILVILNGLCVKVEARFTFNADPVEDESKEEEYIYISPKCAAVLVSGGGVALGGAAFMTPSLFLAGLAYLHPWDSLFSELQRIAMDEVGANVVVSGRGTLGLTYVPFLCAGVDDPDSSMAPVFDGTLAAVKNAQLAIDDAKTECSASETSAIAEAYSSMWNYISNGASQVTLAGKIWGLEFHIKALKNRIQRYKDENRSGQDIEQVGEELMNTKASLLRLLPERVSCLKKQLARARECKSTDYLFHMMLQAGWEDCVKYVEQVEKELMDKEARLQELKQEAAK